MERGSVFLIKRRLKYGTANISLTGCDEMPVF
jgi:hypothetical protein